MIVAGINNLLFLTLTFLVNLLTTPPTIIVEYKINPPIAIKLDIYAAVDKKAFFESS